MSKKPILIGAPFNNPARVHMLIYYKGLESDIDLRSPADFGGLKSDEYRAINPQGKMPALILPSGETLFEAKVVMGYLLDVHAATGPPVGAGTPEQRARASLITQVHDMYIASPNSSDPNVTANQGAMYKDVELIDAPTRAGKVAEIWKQLTVIEGLLIGPFAAGEAITEADFTLWPTVSCFLAFMMPKIFGWIDVTNDERLPKLKAWCAHVGALPAAMRVKDEVMAALTNWERNGKFEPIIAQVKANGDLQWVHPRL